MKFCFCMYVSLSLALMLIPVVACRVLISESVVLIQSGMNFKRFLHAFNESMIIKNNNVPPAVLKFISQPLIN